MKGDAKKSQASTVQAIERNIKTAIVDKVNEYDGEDAVVLESRTVSV